MKFKKISVDIWKKLKKNFSIFKLFVGVILILYMITLISLFVYAIYTSFKDLFAFVDDPVGLPTEWHWENYGLIFKYFFVQSGPKEPKYYMEDMFLFSFLYAGGCALAITFATTLMAYACALFPCKLSNVIYAIVIFAIIFPIVGSLPSEMRIAREIGLYNNFPGNWFMKFSFTNMYFLVIYEAFRGVPKDYKEAAEIDGASMWTIMVSIMFRMVMNIVGTVFIVQFVSLWNDYTAPLVYMPKYPTMALGLMSFSYNTSGPIAGEPYKLGAAVIVFIPLFIVFLLFQRKLMGELSAGGIKG